MDNRLYNVKPPKCCEPDKKPSKCCELYEIVDDVVKKNIQGKQNKLIAGLNITIKDDIISATGGGFTQQQADWAQTDASADDFIKHKPNIYTKTETDALLTDKQDVIDDLATIRSGAQAGATAYQKPVTGIPATDLASDVQTGLAAIDTIEAAIPEQASSSNQLADKNFVNSSIATATATFRGAYNLVTDLHLSVSATHAEIATALATTVQTADNNDYCYVQIPVADDTPTEFAAVERYKFNGTAWEYEYTLNNSGFTAAQWAALNSGITSGLVTKLSDLPTAMELATLLASKANTSDLAEVATSGSYNDLTDKPNIPDITGKADKVSNAINGNFAALDSNGNLIDSGHKHSDYLTQHQDLSNYVQKSQTTGLLKNDGTVDTTQYLTQHQDISGKADKNEMSVVPGTGADADKTTITLKQGTSATVLTAHQDISGKENVMPITTATGATLSAVVGNYYRLDNVGTLTITLPTIVGATKLQAITFLLICGPNAVVTFVPQDSETTILYQENFPLEADTTYEVTALWNGSEWTLSRVIYE